MKINCLCEKCGNDQFKSLTSPLSFKYGSTIHIPCFECKICNERYAVLPTKSAIIVEQIAVVLITIIILIFFFSKYPYPSNEKGWIFNFIVLIVCGFALLYGILITLWNYLKSYIGLKPLHFDFVHIDKEYTEIINKNERIDFIADTIEVKKRIKKIREGSVYLCKVGSKIGAVKLVKINLFEKRIELLLKNVSVCDDVYNNLEFILYTPQSKELCRGLIRKMI